MSLQKNSFSDIISPSARYSDDFLSYNQDRAFFEQGITLNYIDALSAPNDSKISNYSSVYLTNLKTDREVFDVNLLPTQLSNIITYIAVLSSNNNLAYLNFDTVNTLPISGYANSYSIVTSSGQPDTSRLFYQLEIFNDSTCRIKHTREETDLFLTFDRSLQYSTGFYFLTSASFDDLPEYYNSGYPDGFDYVLDDSGFVYFSKLVGGDYHVLCVENSQLVLKRAVDSSVFDTNVCLFRILLTNTSLDPKINTSWVSYNPESLYNLQVNTTKSGFDYKTNNLLHFEYQNISDINYIEFNTLKLKNLYTDKFISKRGNPIIESGMNSPTPFFREYTNIYTGGDQEVGYKDITLNYVYYNVDLAFPSNTTTDFTTPSSVYPFDQLNINDTSFAIDGALGADTPLLSDKVTAKNGINLENQFGTYLTTWLSGGTWLDRYYFPDIITRQNALSGNAVYTPTFDNIVSQLAYNNRSRVANYQYFDVVSDLVFSPNESYSYTRVGSNDIETYVNNISGLIQQDFTFVINNENIINTQTFDVLSLDGSNYTTIPVKTINDSGSFSVFFTLQNALDKKFSYVFGNIVDSGIGIYSDSAITPMLYVKSGNSVNVYNTDTSLLYSLSFDDVVTDVADPAGLSHFHIIAGTSVYNLATDGTILDRVNLPQINNYLDLFHYTTPTDEKIVFLLSDNSTFVDYNTTTKQAVTGNVTIFSNNETTPTGIYIYNNVVYGFEAGQLKIDSQGYLYGVFDETILVRYNLKEPNTNPIVFARSNSAILDFNIDPDNNVYILHNNYELTKVDKNRKFLDSMSFVDTLTCYSIDFVNEYRYDDGNGGNSFYPIVLAHDFNNAVYTIKNIDFNTNVNTTTLAEGCVYNGEKQNITGYNFYIGNTDYQNLNFEVFLINIFNTSDKQKFKFATPLSNLSKFYNTFCFNYSNDGELSVYINGAKIYSQEVDRYKYIGNIFVKDDIAVGSIPFHNNTILGDFLGIPSYGKLNESAIYNFRIYNDGLSDTEVKSLFLQINGEVDTLYTSLPCGQRNGMEEIQSIFKVSQPSSKSNVVDIVVKDTTITDRALQSQIATSVLQGVKDILPGDVTVRDVKFINY